MLGLLQDGGPGEAVVLIPVNSSGMHVSLLCVLDGRNRYDSSHFLDGTHLQLPPQGGRPAWLAACQVFPPLAQRASRLGSVQAAAMQEPALVRRPLSLKAAFIAFSRSG